MLSARARGASFTELQFICLIVVCIASQQHASVSQGRICTDTFTSCHTEIEVADRIFYLTQSLYTDTRPTLYRQGPGGVATWLSIFKWLVLLDPEKSPQGKRESNPGLPLASLTP